MLYHLLAFPKGVMNNIVNLAPNLDFYLGQNGLNQYKKGITKVTQSGHNYAIPINWQTQ